MVPPACTGCSADVRAGQKEQWGKETAMRSTMRSSHVRVKHKSPAHHRLEHLPARCSVTV